MINNIHWKDIIYVVLQLLLFLLFIINWKVVDLHLPSLVHVEIAAVTVVIIGLLMAFAGIVQLDESLTPFPTPRAGGKLIQTGLYKYIRHPIYTGVVMAMLGYSVYSLSIERLTCTIAILVLFYFKSLWEERLLLRKFREYEEYMGRTGRFMPKWFRR